MSAAGRGASRVEHDFYATPEWVVEALANKMKPEAARAMQWGEPCAGDGAVMRGMWRALGIEPRQWEWAEIREGIDYTKEENAFIFDGPAGVITNPPFSIAQKFIELSRDEVPFCAYLLRLNFLGSQRRREFWQTNSPSHLYTLSKRPSFTGKGTDATEYAWFVWDDLDLMQDKPGIYVL